MIDFAVYSNKGSREINEDYVSSYADGNRFCFVVADGLGGEGQGDMASRFVCNHTVAIAEKTKVFDGDFLNRCFTLIQKNLMRAKEALGLASGMTSTLSILTFENNMACWGHIGDTRIYCFSEKEIVSVSNDHSLAQFMISSNMSDITDIRCHPDRSTLMAAMGMENMNGAYDIDAEDFVIKSPMCFLICTDGFWQYINENELMKIISKYTDAETVMKKLNEVARNNSIGEDRDNYSAIFVKYIPE